jgi:RNA polymerase sigma-70 factor (ECF subfamily)
MSEEKANVKRKAAVANKIERQSPQPGLYLVRARAMAAGTQVIWSLAIPMVEEPAADLEDLVEKHSALLFRIAYSVLRNLQDAEDAVQETFLRALRHQKKLAQVADTRAWLARVAWRVALDRRRRRPEVPLEEAAAAVQELWAAGAASDRIAADRQMMALLEGLIAGLPAELRQALTLSTVEEMPAAEVATVLEIPEATVRTRVFRARQILKEKLAALLEARHA